MAASCFFENLMGAAGLFVKFMGAIAPIDPIRGHREGGPAGFSKK